MPPANSSQELILKLIHIFVSPLIFFGLLFAFIKLVGPLPLTINSTQMTKTDTFQVTGEGTVNIKPDTANVRAGVQANGPTAEGVQEKMNTTINKVIDGIKALGIEEKDIKTDNYNVNPNYEYSSGTQKINGYVASTNITVKVKDTNLVNKIIDTASTNGANVIGGADFQVDAEAGGKTAAENEARKKAIEDAHKKAEEISKIAGFKLGKLINYTEGYGGGERPMAMYDKAGVTAAGAGANIQPGTNEIRISVTLSYEVN